MTTPTQIHDASATRPARLWPAIRVGEWLVDASRNEFCRGDEVVRVEPKVAELLMQLASRPGEVLSRGELLEAVWPGVVVGDDALTQAVNKLRRALGDDVQHPRYVETISKRGYRLVAVVERERQDCKPSHSNGNTPAFGSRARIAGVATLAAAIAGVVVIFGAGNSWRTDRASGELRNQPTVGVPTVAVLPLANLSGDPKRDYFSDGITEDITHGLGRFSGIRVISPNAVRALKGRSAQSIRNEVDARYILQGSVREADGRVRVSVELSDGREGALLWSQRYDGDGLQLFEIQDRIVRDIVGALHVKLTQLEQQRSFSRPTNSLEAHELLLRARSLLVRGERRANREARELLAQAANLAPNYADVLTARGEAEWQRATFGWIEDAEEGLQRAEGYAMRTLATADQRSHAGAHALLAEIYATRGDFDDALKHAQRAIELNPSDTTALYRRGDVLLWSGNIQSATADLETAKRLEPHAGAHKSADLVIAYYVAGRYREALTEADVALATDSSDDFLHALRAAALARLGSTQEARREAAEVRRLSPNFDAGSFGSRFADPKYTRDLHQGLRLAGLEAS